MKQIYVVIAVFVALGVFGWQQRTTGRLEAENTALKARIAQVDTVYLQRTDTLRVVRTRTDSILKTDTLFHWDTVVKIVEAERVACNAVIQSCEDKVRLLNLRYANLEKQKDERFLGIKLPSRTLMFGAGILTGVVLTR